MTDSQTPPVDAVADGGLSPSVEVLLPRDVPLGGPRAMRVRRTLPQRHRSLIGAWCFVDHYGPDDVAETGGMSVAPHPHIGLSTVSWLFTGEIEHRDSAGNHAMVRPGELNLMTAGRGVSHSEVSTAETDILHGVQLWLALPESARVVDPGFDHYVPPAVRGPGWEARVFLGSLLGSDSPVSTHTPLVGAELMLAKGRTLTVDLEPGFEHGILLDVGDIAVDGHELFTGDLAYLAPGRHTVEMTATEECRVVLIGGQPFGEDIVMWWNFVGRTHQDVVAARTAWQEQITRDGAVLGDSREVADGRFGVVSGQPLAPIPAPALPNVRLRSRGNR